MALLLAEGGFTAEAMPALDQCLALAADARRLIAGDVETDPTVAAEPPAPQSLDDIAGTIGRLLEHFQAWWNQGGPSETGLIYDSWVSGWV
jgi:hypothetical protein